jgi:hypothetical protein
VATVSKSWMNELSEGTVRGGAQSLGGDQCPRCRGLMISEHGIGSLNDPASLDFLAWRCVQCGEVVDPVIVRNRRLHLTAGSGEDQGGSRVSRSKKRS